MDNLPGAMFVVDVKREAIAVAEANRLKIPVIAVVDTNCDPDPVDYPIPGNDDAIRAVRIMVDSISSTIQQAANEYAKVAADEARSALRRKPPPRLRLRLPRKNARRRKRPRRPPSRRRRPMRPQKRLKKQRRKTMSRPSEWRKRQRNP